jgi:hypothetical protein
MRFQSPGRAAFWCRCPIIYAKKPFKKLAPEQGIEELFVGGRDKSEPAPALGPQEAHLSMAELLSLLRIGCFTSAERVHIRPLRKKALKKSRARGCSSASKNPTAWARFFLPC